jgi:hypothetical protein
MPQAGFEPAIPATKLPETYALDWAATGIGDAYLAETNISALMEPKRLLPCSETLNPILSHLHPLRILTS